MGQSFGFQDNYAESFGI